MAPLPPGEELPATRPLPAAVDPPSPAAGAAPTERVRGVPLLWLLLVPMVLLPAISTGLITFLSRNNDRLYHERIEEQIQAQTNREVQGYLRHYLQTAQQTIRVMAGAVADGEVDPADQIRTTRFLWRTARTFPTVPYLNFGLASGDFIGVGQNRNTPGQLYLEVASRHRVGQLKLHPLNGEGRIGPLAATEPFGDFRHDDWYRQPLEAGGLVFTRIYNWVDAPEMMALGVGMPIRRQGTLIGVAGADLFLSRISDFLRTLPVGAGGRVYLVDPQGLLVAQSSPGLPFSIRRGRGQRIAAAAAPEPVIRSTAQVLLQRFGSLGRIQAARNLQFPIEGKTMFVRIEPFHDPLGLDWRIVTVLSEADIHGHLEQDDRNNLLIAIGTIGLSVLAGMQVVRLIRNALGDVIVASEAMAAGAIERRCSPGPIVETSRLAVSFNAMAARLMENFRSLEQQNVVVRESVQRRTHELRQTNQQLQEEILKRTRVESDLKLANRELEILANTDRLTGVANRNRFDRQFLQEWNRLRRGGAAPLSADGGRGSLQALQRRLRPPGR